MILFVPKYGAIPTLARPTKMSVPTSKAFTARTCWVKRLPGQQINVGTRSARICPKTCTKQNRNALLPCPDSVNHATKEGVERKSVQGTQRFRMDLYSFHGINVTSAGWSQASQSTIFQDRMDHKGCWMFMPVWGDDDELIALLQLQRKFKWWEIRRPRASFP